MLEKFNGIIYLAIFLIHFIGFAYYGFRCVFQTQSFLSQYGMHDTGAGIVRFFGSIFINKLICQNNYFLILKKSVFVPIMQRTLLL